MPVEKLVAGLCGLLMVACTGDDTGDSGGEGGTGSTSDGTVTSTRGDDVTEGSDSDGTGATKGEETSADSTRGSDDATDSSDTGSEAGLAVQVVPSSFAVLEDDDDGELTVRCLVTEDGAPYSGTVDATVTVSDSMSRGDAYTFAEFGIVDVTCDVEVEGEMLSATVQVAVLNEAIDPQLAAIGAGLGRATAGLHDVIASDGLDDQVLVEAMDNLGAALPALEPTQYAALTDVLRTVPGGYPDAATLDGMGIAANADDAALPGALADLDAALAAMQTTVAAFDPDNPSQADADALASHRAEIESAVQTLTSMTPTAHGLLASRTEVADLMRNRIAPSTETLVGWVDARVRSEADGVFATIADHPDPQGFGFLSLTIGMFGDSSLQVTLINEWYGDYIAQLDESINNFILAGGIEYFLPLGDNPPTIEYFVGSASAGFATPGYPSWVDGYNFSEDPEMNLILVFGDSWQGIVDNILGACGVEEANTVPEKIVAVFECAQEVQEAVQSIFVTPVSVGPGIYGSQQGIDIGPFPDVCSGGLPTATFLLPISYVNGRGESYFVNCI